MTEQHRHIPQAEALGYSMTMGGRDPSCSSTDTHSTSGEITTARSLRMVQGHRVSPSPSPPVPEMAGTIVQQVAVDEDYYPDHPEQEITNLLMMNVPDDDEQEHQVDIKCPGPLKYRTVQLGMLILLAMASLGVVSAFFVVLQANKQSSATTSSNTSPLNNEEEWNEEWNNPALPKDPHWDPEVRLVEITDLLIERGLATPSTFLEPASPRARTLDWLVYQDRTFIPLDTEENQNRFVQRYACMVFAFSTGVELWQVVERWVDNPHRHVCGFAGIHCSTGTAVLATGLEVIGMDMPLWRLSGTIPSELSVLTGLTSLMWKQNKLKGSIPDSFYDLTNLESLMFYQNQLGGTISPKIRQLSNLKELYIHSNRFEGTLPMSSLQALSKLEVFWIEDNRFQGPFFDALSSWPRLKMLGVSDLPGMDGGTTLPTEIGELTRLEYITLGDMHPRLPTEIGNLWNLGSLSIRKPRLSGADTQSATIPTEIGQLTNLWSLTLVGDDLLTGTIPTEVGLLTNLKHLGIRESHIGGQFPSELGLLTKLTGFQVRQLRDVHGTVPSELGNIALGPLRFFQIGGTKLTGTLPKQFCASNAEVSMSCWLLQCTCCSHLNCGQLDISNSLLPP